MRGTPKPVFSCEVPPTSRPVGSTVIFPESVAPPHAKPAGKTAEKCSKCRFSRCVRVLTTSCKRAENVLSLHREKRGYAPRAYPLFCCIDYQRLTRSLYVHIAPPGCTYRKNSKYFRRSGVYSRGGKTYICATGVACRTREPLVTIQRLGKLVVFILNYCCPLKLFERKKIGLDSSLGIQPY